MLANIHQASAVHTIPQKNLLNQRIAYLYQRPLRFRDTHQAPQRGATIVDNNPQPTRCNVMTKFHIHFLQIVALSQRNS